MKNLLDEVKTVLEAQTYPVTVKSIRPSYSKLAPAYPMVIIDEVNNTTRLAVNGEEILSDITYQIDIFLQGHDSRWSTHRRKFGLQGNRGSRGRSTQQCVRHDKNQYR